MSKLFLLKNLKTFLPLVVCWWLLGRAQRWRRVVVEGMSFSIEHFDLEEHGLVCLQDLFTIVTHVLSSQFTSFIKNDRYPFDKYG